MYGAVNQISVDVVVTILGPDGQPIRSFDKIENGKVAVTGSR